MNGQIKHIVLSAIKTQLDNLDVDGTTVKYYTDRLGMLNEGIYMGSYTQDDDGSKHVEASTIRMNINTFSQSITRTTAITREVMSRLKASVYSKLQLSNGWVANYTLIPSVSSFQEQEGAITRHRDVITLQLRVGQSNNE
jgi:hypothetical protein